MSLFGLLDIGKSALFAAQTGLNTTSNNIANINTPEYSRQDVVLNVSSPVQERGGYLGTGVTVSGIQSSYNASIEAQITGQTQSQGSSNALQSGLGQVEQVFNETNSMGLAQPLADFFNAWSALAANPSGQSERQVLLQKATSLVNTAKNMESSLTGLVKQTNDQINSTVNKVNTLAADIADLNGKIMQVEAGQSGQKAVDLRDQRSAALNQLASLTQLSSYEDSSGSLNITVGMRNLVSGTKANSMSTPLGTDGDRSLILDNTDITASVSKGSLGGLISLRQEVEGTQLLQLRRLAASVTTAVNQQHEAGYGLDGIDKRDFFNQLQLSTVNNSAGGSLMSASITDPTLLTLDEYTVSFDPTATNFNVVDNQTGASVVSGVYNAAGTTIGFDGIQVDLSGPVNATDTFTVSPLTNAVSNFGVAITDKNQIAAASSAASVPGDGSNATAIMQLSGTATADIGGSTFSDYYKSIVSGAGVASSNASDNLTYDNNMLSSLQTQRESVSGVSLDEEAANLIKYQRSYQAAARVISTTDALIQSLIDMVG